MRLLTATIVAGLVLCGHAMPIIKIDTPDYTQAPDPSAQPSPVVQVYRQATSANDNTPGVGAPPVARPVAIPVHKTNEDDNNDSNTAEAASVPVMPTVASEQQAPAAQTASQATLPTMAGLSSGANVASGMPTTGFGTVNNGLPGTIGTDMSNSMGLGSAAGTLGTGATGAPTTGSASAPQLSAWDQAVSDYQKGKGTGTGTAGTAGTGMAGAAQSGGMMASPSSSPVGGSLGAPTVTVSGTPPGTFGAVPGVMGSTPGVALGTPGATTQGGTQMSVIQASAVTDINGLRGNAIDAAAGMNQQQVGVSAASGVPGAGGFQAPGALNNGMSTMSGLPGSTTNGLTNTGGTVGVSPLVPTISVGGTMNTGFPGTGGMATTPGMIGTGTTGSTVPGQQTTGSLGF